MRISLGGKYPAFEITESIKQYMSTHFWHRVRNIYAKANNVLRSCTDTEQRIKLLDAWRAYEEVAGTEASLGKVLKLMPRKVTKRKQISFFFPGL